MWNWLLDPFLQYAFMRSALLGCVLVCVSAIPVGVFMILRRMSLTGDAMAHAILPGVAVAYWLGGFSLVGMTIGGLSAGVLVALSAGWIARVWRLHEDASLASLYLVALAAGVVILSAAGNRIDLFHVLFGSVLGLKAAALKLLAGIATLSLLILSVIFRPLVLDSLNPALAAGSGRQGAVAHYGFTLLMVLNLVAGFQALGTLMAVGLMILPAAAARFCVDSLPLLMAVAVALGIVGSMCGLFLSFYAALPAGPAIVLVLGVFYLIALTAARLRQTAHHQQIQEF
jgi:zinc/manganese transport system permease protein